MNEVNSWIINTESLSVLNKIRYYSSYLSIDLFFSMTAER